MSEPVVRLSDRYELLEEIGSGGEAIVYRAIDHQQDQPVALRVTRAGAAAPTPADPLPPWHPLWIGYLGAGRDEPSGVDFQVLEYVPGESLAVQLTRAPLSREAWRNLLHDALAALAALHATGWAHGDLNGGSFVQARTSGAWRMLDLPFLRHLRPEDLSPYFGQIETIAPERLDGARPNVASDLYALGCLAYAAATGHYPHPGTSEAAVAIHHLRFPPEPLSGWPHALSPVEAAWTMRLLARNPAERFSTAAEAAGALQAIA